MTLTALGTAFYNGYTFSPEMVTLSLSGSPELDRARRTVKFTRWRIVLRDYIHGIQGATTDAQLAAARLALMANGGEFIYKDKGFGDLTINSGGPKWDVDWGPKWTLFDADIKGRDQGWQITWGVEVCVPEHCSKPSYTFSLMSVTYRLNIAIDRDGYTTRTYSGELQIPQTRPTVDSRIVQHTADEMFERINPGIPFGFRRTSRNRDLDESKNVLTWTIVDEETPQTSLQPDVIDCDASHEVSNIGPGLVQWGGTIRATYKMGRHVSPALAAARFLEWASDRINFTNRSPLLLAPKCVIVNAFSMQQGQVFGREAGTFSLGYRFFCKFTDVLMASSLWRPVPGTDYQIWVNSLVNGGPMSLRGNAQLRVNASDDKLVDLCSGDFSPPKGSGSVKSDDFDGVADLIAAFFPAPAPENSWLNYDNSIRIVSDSGSSVLTTLPVGNLQPSLSTKPLSLGDYLTSIGPAGSFALGQGGEGVNIQNQQQGSTPGGNLIADMTGQATEQGSEIIQYNQNPDVRVWLIGSAARACYGIPYPTLTQFGDSPVVPTGASMAEQRVIAQWGGIPIIGANWALQYRVINPGQGGLGVPVNPSLLVG